MIFKPTPSEMFAPLLTQVRDFAELNAFLQERFVAGRQRRLRGKSASKEVPHGMCKKEHCISKGELTLSKGAVGA